MNADKFAIVAGVSSSNDRFYIQTHFYPFVFRSNIARWTLGNFSTVSKSSAAVCLPSLWFSRQDVIFFLSHVVRTRIARRRCEILLHSGAMNQTPTKGNPLADLRARSRAIKILPFAIIMIPNAQHSLAAA